MEKKVIDRVRKYYNLPEDISDEWISFHCRNSLGEAIGRLHLAKEDFFKAVRKRFPKIFKNDRS